MIRIVSEVFEGVKKRLHNVQQVLCLQVLEGDILEMDDQVS
jgi:hypothetical protein